MRSYRQIEYSLVRADDAAAPPFVWRVLRLGPSGRVDDPATVEIGTVRQSVGAAALGTRSWQFTCAPSWAAPGTTQLGLAGRRAAMEALAAEYERRVVKSARPATR